ncbi:hypothetical protein GE09DRAFT_1059012 [Coniochaeta sp. 2T2.1]|nr:hypothetical protein GE09DRAFT_1059012 [Coniochaeta sp. 2T2.1]
MFRNPVIVKGYPIPRRAKSQTGLEMSLDSVATMTNAKRLVEFCGKTIIKGFSTMLVASAVVEDIVFWHHFFNPDGRFISYSDKAMSQSGTHCSVSFDVVEKSRHIVGWCEEVRCFAGAADANYDIEALGLPKSHSKCAFTNVSISAGKFITVGTTCVPRIKDKPTHISYGDDYLERPCGACHWHECLPHGKHYLAASTYELSKIIESFGSRDSRDSRAWHIVDNIHWYTPDKVFEACQCSSTQRRLHDRVQVFIPPKLVKRVLKTTTPRPKLPQNGAIILGRSKKYPIRWPAQGDPDEGQPEDDDGQGEITDLNDSGIGTSAGSSLIPLRGSTTPTSDETRKLYHHCNDQFIRQEEEVTQAMHHGNSSAQSDWRVDTDYADKRAEIRKGKRKAPISADVQRGKQRHRDSGREDDQ